MASEVEQRLRQMEEGKLKLSGIDNSVCNVFLIESSLSVPK